MDINVNGAEVVLEGDNLIIKLTPELRRQLKLEKVPIRDLNVGDTFLNGRFIVVKQTYDATSVVQQEPIKDVNIGADGDYKASMLRHKLQEYAPVLLKLFGEFAVVLHEVDLRTLNGYDAYGHCFDYVSAMTFDRFREFHKIIGNCGEDELLCTTHDVGNLSYIVVNNEGRVICPYRSSGYYVRPFFTLRPDTMVIR